jgi:hypothetical protein
VPFGLGGTRRAELLLDVLNLLDETAEEAWRPTICSARTSVGQFTTFVDPRRAMIGVRLNLGN